MELFEGIAKLAEGIANSNTEQKISLLPQALKYGELGIDLLIDCLSDREIEIRAKAYQLLQDVELEKAKNAIAPGLLFNSGDKIYYIRESTMWFDDSFYTLYCPSNTNLVKHLSTYDDYKNRGYKIIRITEAVYITSYILYFVDYQKAQTAAELLQNKRVFEVSLGDFDLKHDTETIKQWCDRYQITKEVIDLQIERDKQSGLYKLYESQNIIDSIDIYWFTVEQYLKSIQDLNLLNQLWQDLVGKFASIGEIVFDRTTYLNIDRYYSQILEHQNTYKYSLGEDVEELSLSSEEAEIDALLTALNDPKLEIRSLAYQLLQGVDSEKAQQAIYQGLRLNPGDNIYSVYQAGICYSDEILYTLWDYVDYPEQLRYQIEENKRYRTEQSQRIYCYTNKQQAELTAETLHRHLIKETKISFEWRKENPNFDVKQWCINNNFPYKSEWDSWSDLYTYQIIFEIKDVICQNDKLSNNFRRSRYIYHPKHIDTWCNDNQIEYDRDLDNWENYRKLIDYLHLPENIELLSKFWKDGIGHMAFVKEEVVQQTTYVKIGKKLDPKLGEDKVFAVPKEFEAEAAKLLVEIIDRKSTESKARSKARKMLREND